ncbi:MAG TPA: NAD(P)H-dependent oxidoreductase subunit E, partial [Thermodesulfovibrionales bacterium]|nr:NAD(P)H-dependent oxidoreductase subunit E [Thermodesulfovibrionales bacterium]
MGSQTEKLRSIGDLRKLRERLGLEVFTPGSKRARVCCGTACTASGSHKVVAELGKEAEKRDLDLDIIKTGCQGMCQKGPIMKVEPHDIFYQRVKPQQAASLISHTFVSGMPLREALYRESIISEPTTKMLDLPFYKKQVRVALRNNDKIDPTNIEHYIAVGGYAALE